MTQAAQNDRVTLQADTWTLISEINCTFVVTSGIQVEFLGKDGEAPSSEDRGIPYALGQGEDADTDMFSRFPGCGTMDRLYAISRGRKAELFVSRAAVA